MSFVDELNKMPPPVMPKSLEEREIERLTESSHESIKRFCVDRRSIRTAQGFLVLRSDTEFGTAPSISCYEQLYRKNYPYKLQIESAPRMQKSTLIKLELGDDVYEYGYERRVISQDKTYCDRLIASLQPLLKADGFSTIAMRPIPVYAAEIRQYYKSRLLTSDWFEEGRLTDQLEGYVIQFELKW